MHELYPTPTRLALLREVDNKRVTRTYHGDSVIDRDADYMRVNARIAELESAGWVFLTPKAPDRSLGARPMKLWRLTDAGRAVLEAAGGAP